MKFSLLFAILYSITIGSAFSQVNCNNWLVLSNSLDGVTVGDLDMTGTKITVEAVFNRTDPYYGGPSYAGDIVSKHLNRLDCNYLLRPGHAEITTVNGFFVTPETCEIKLNKTYHVAMVYDGNTLKFYRNGFLMGQVNATGNLITNDWLTKIGETAGPNPDDTQFKGFINEVRIWNVARTQVEIRNNMSSSLSNPSAQSGLIACYTFNNLLNKQGNAAWNGSIVGSAIANSTNTSCNFIADSCDLLVEKCAVTAGKDTSICSGSKLQLNATGAVSYVWSPATGLSSAFAANPTTIINSTTTYVVTGTTSSGCTSKDTITVNALPNPIIKAINDTSFCGSGSVQLDATGADFYRWTPSTGLSNSAIADPIATVSANTTYIVTGTKSNGCSAKDTIIIKVLAKPIITLTNDTTICNYGSVKLFASGGQTYQWYPSKNLNNAVIPDPVATPSESTKYYVTVTDNNNCSSKDSVDIIVKSSERFTVTPKSTAICSASSIQLTAAGGDSYKWQPSSGLSDPLISNPVAKPDTTTIYQVSVKDSHCNNDTTLSVLIKINNKPIVTVFKDGDFSCNKPTVQLYANGGGSYTWTPSSALNNPRIQNPVATVPSNTTFYVSVLSSEGCSTNDSIHVNFIAGGNPQAFLLPNAFTPNGDGLNDCFGINKWGNVEVRQMEVFNRLGELVFKGKDGSRCWDGTFKGVMQQTGAFPYIIKVKTLCGEVARKGIVLLIR